MSTQATPTSLPAASLSRTVQRHAMPGFIFFLLCFLMVDYFGRLPARLPLYPHLRPTLLLVLFIGFSLITQGDRLKDRFREPPLILITVLAAYIILSVPLVEWPGSVVKINLKDFVKAAVFLFFVATIVDTDQRLKTFVGLFIGLQVFRVLEPVFYYWETGSLNGYTYVSGEFQGRLNGAPADVVNANGLAFVIVSTLTFMHFTMLRSPARWVRFAYYLLLPLMVYALYLTASRGGFIVFAIFLAFAFWDTRRKGLFAAAALIAVIVGWTQMSDFHKDRYLSLFTPLSLVDEDIAGSGTVEGRIEGMKKEFALGMQRPIVGHGLGTTPEAKVNKLGERAQAAHNLYAQLLIETGIIGFTIFMSYIVSIFRLVRRNRAQLAEMADSEQLLTSFYYRLNKALFVIFWIYVVYSFNYYGLSQNYWYLYGGLCVAFARSLRRNLQAEASNNRASLSGAPA